MLIAAPLFVYACNHSNRTLYLALTLIGAAVSRINEQNFRPLEPCDECPAFNGMDNIAVARTANLGMPEGEFVVAGSFPDRMFYAYDPTNTLAGNVVLGADRGCEDAFCGRHESASSRVLGETHHACSGCTGPKEIPVGLLRRRTRTVCGAGLEKDRGLVSRLNRVARRQGRSALSSVDTVITSSPRH